jgi:tetratricopeptide (TPR) repeat protein
VLAYYSKQDTSQLSDDALVQRSQALNLMAEVAFDRGNLDEAEKLYQQAMAGTAEAVRRSPDDGERLYKHAQNVFWVGEVARWAGRPKESETAYREYKRVADQMTALQPDNLKYRMEVLYADEDVGISIYNQHRFAEATRQFEAAAAPMQQLVSLYPANTTYRKEFATLLAWMADARRAEGNLPGAIAARQQQISALNRLLDMAADSDARSRLIAAHEGLGVALAESGQSDGAIAELQSAIAEAENLIPIEPRNAQWKSMAADARLQLALAFLSLGRRDDAAQQTAAGCNLAAAVPASLAAAHARLSTNCAMVRSRIALAAGATQQASDFASRALASSKGEHSQDPVTDRYRVAQMYRLLGDARKSAGDSTGAEEAWKAGLAELPTGATERPWEMNEHALLLIRLGDRGDAAALSGRLDAIGYRRLT